MTSQQDDRTVDKDRLETMNLQLLYLGQANVHE